MDIVCVILILVCFIICYILNRREGLFYPSTFFCLLWFVITFLGVMHFGNLVNVSLNVYAIILLGTLSFSLGGVLAKNNRISFCVSAFKTKDDNLYTCHIRRVFFLIVVFCSALYIFYIAPKLALYRIGYSLGDVRYGDILTQQRGGIFNYFAIYVCYPVVFAGAVIYTIQGIINNEKIYKFIFPAYLFILIILGDGARKIIIYLLFVILLAFNKSNRKIHFSFRKIIILVAIIGAFIFVTLQRTNGSIESVFSSVASYASGSLVLFDHTLNSSAYYYSELSYGMLFILGFIRPINVFLSLLGVEWDILTADYFSYMLQHTNVHTTANSSGYFNFFSTCFAYFYKDGMLIGVIAFSLIYGFCAVMCYKKLKYFNNIKWICVYAYVLCGLATSMMSYQFSNYLDALTLVVIALAFTNKEDRPFFKKSFNRAKGKCHG